MKRSNIADTPSLSAVSELSFHTAYGKPENYKLTLDVRNITDAPNNRSSLFDTYEGIPGDPRSVMLGFQKSL